MAVNGFIFIPLTNQV